MLVKSEVVLGDIAHETWDEKYRWKTFEGKPLDASVGDTWRRVAQQLAEPEGTDAGYWESRFYSLLESRKFLPAGRILTGAGTGMKTTLFNCFVMGEINDSMEGILDAHREAMLSLRMGGGTGNDFSSIRPEGAPVYGVNSVASGPLSFMDIWDTACRTLIGAGTRRGAMMATLRCDHPDIEAFVDAKLDKARFRNFNLSVTVTDDFMIAVHEDRPWDLKFGGQVYKTIRARDLWNRIMKNTYDAAEPGVIFIDRVNQMNNLHYCEEISCSNPCGEQMLPPYGACLLGSVNLTKFVHNPFTSSAFLAVNELQTTVTDAVRMMDNVIDVSKFPLPQQEEEAKNKRRIGLGVTGLANALAMCRIRYGTEQAAETVEAWQREITEAAYLASTHLAKEKGSFPLYDPVAYQQGEFIQQLPDHVRNAIEENGIRNALLTSVAPTGTISLFAGNVSSGVEPPFSYKYNRKVLMADGSRKAKPLEDFAYRLYRDEIDPDEGNELPHYFVTALELSPAEHLRMLAATQRWVDSSVSKTVNLPKEISFDDFKDVYWSAYDQGIKCCATYRPNDITGSVLEVSDRGENAAESLKEQTDLLLNPPEREDVLPGFTHKLKWPTSDHAMYVTINDVIDNGKRRPYEIFINSKSMEHYAWTVALTRMISAVFRRGGEVRFVVEELKAIFDPRGGAWVPSDGGSKYVPSVLAQIGGTIEKHMIETGFTDKPVLSAETLDDVPAGTALRQCPRCGEASIVRQEGCDKCMACGHSKCG